MYPRISNEIQVATESVVTGTGDVGSVDADVRAIPSFPTLGDDDLPPIVVTKPGATGLPE